MTQADIVQRAFDAFREELRDPPSISLRGGNDIDSYDLPAPFDALLDSPTDEYIERHAYWALPHLDATSWRHYLPRLIEYSLAHPDDGAMVTEAVVHSLRPPDRYPPRLGALTESQEIVVRAFLETLAVGDPAGGCRDEAQQALEEWWWPNPRSRLTEAELEDLRATAVTYRDAVEDEYRLAVPDTLSASGVRNIPSEFRRVQTWGGYLCGDVPAVIAVNVLARTLGSIEDAVGRYATFFQTGARPRPIQVPGARRAMRLDGVTLSDPTAGPQHLIMIVAEATDVVALTMRACARDDVHRVLDAIAASFALTQPDA